MYMSLTEQSVALGKVKSYAHVLKKDNPIFYDYCLNGHESFYHGHMAYTEEYDNNRLEVGNIVIELLNKKGDLMAFSKYLHKEDSEMFKNPKAFCCDNSRYFVNVNHRKFKFFKKLKFILKSYKEYIEES